MTTYHPHNTRYVNNSDPNWRKAYHEGYAAHYEQLLKDRHGSHSANDMTVRGREEWVDHKCYRIANCTDAQLRMIAWRLTERDCNAAIKTYEANRKARAA